MPLLIALWLSVSSIGVEAQPKQASELTESRTASGLGDEPTPLASNAGAQLTLDPPTTAAQNDWKRFGLVWDMPKSFAVAYIAENVLRPGVLVGFDTVPAQSGAHQLVVSPQLGVTVFSPFTTSWSARIRAMYRVKFDFGLRLRPLGLSLYYNHSVPNADVYAVEDGDVVEVTDWGYGRVRLLATTGLGYDLSKVLDHPLSVFFDIGMSAETFFGVYRFHLEHALGLAWTF